MIRVVIADDSPELRTALQLLFRLHPDLELVGMAVNGAEALACVRQQQPDVLVMDIRMPPHDGLAVVQEIQRLGSLTRVILMSFEIGDFIIRKASERGAQGYIPKDRLAEHLPAAIRAVGHGAEYFVEQ